MNKKKLILIFILLFAFMPTSEIYADESLVKEGIIVMSKKIPGTTGDQFDLFWTNLAQGNGNLFQITNTPDCNEIQPSISPDGQFVAFSSDCNGVGDYFDGFYRIYIHNISDPAPNPSFLTSADTMKSGASWRSKFNSFNPSWGSWQGNPNKDSNKQANGPILFQSDLNGDMGIYMKFAGPGWNLPAIKIMDKPGVDEIEPSIHPTGPRSGGKNFQNKYVYSWVEQGGTSKQGISVGTFEDPYINCAPGRGGEDGYATGYSQGAEIQNFNFKPGCEDLGGSKWTMGIEGNSVDWYTGYKDPSEKHFPGSKGEPVFTFIRKVGLLGTTKIMWATTPNSEVFGQKELVVGEFGGYKRFGADFAEIKQPRFSPYGDSAYVIAHFMRDTNPLATDQGSIKMLKFPDNIEEINIKAASRDFDWGRSFISSSNYSLKQNDKSNNIQKEAEKIKNELRQLQEKTQEKKEEEESIMEEERILQKRMLDNLSREEQIELDKDRQILEEKRRNFEQEAELDFERQKLELEMRRQELEMEQQKEQMQLMMEELEARGAIYEEEKCYVEDLDEGRGLFENLNIGAEIQCEIGNNMSQKLEDPAFLAMTGLMITVAATFLQMARGN